MPVTDTGFNENEKRSKMRETLDSSAEYDALKRQAHIDRALSELAEGRSPSFTTLKARDESAMRNELGDIERQRMRYDKNVDYALAEYGRKQAADEEIYKNKEIARQKGAEIQKQRFDAELGLQRQYHELNQKNSVFDQMYKLYTKRLVDKNDFKAATGITVKAMPTPSSGSSKPKPTVRFVGETEPKKAARGYSIVKLVNKESGKATYYEVKTPTAIKIQEKGVDILDENGSIKSDVQLGLETGIEGFSKADTATQVRLIEENKDSIVEEYGETKYGLALQMYSIKNNAGEYIDAGIVSVREINELLVNLDSIVMEKGVEAANEAIKKVTADLSASLDMLKNCINGIEIQVLYDESNTTIMGLVKKYGITYDLNDYEDRVRKVNGIMPKMFEEKLGVIAQDVISSILDYEKPAVWTQENVTELLGNYLLVDVGNRSMENFAMKVDRELTRVKQNPDYSKMSQTELWALARSNVERDAAEFRIRNLYPDDAVKQQQLIDDMNSTADFGFEIAKAKGATISYFAAYEAGAYFKQMDADQQALQVAAASGDLLLVNDNEEYKRIKSDPGRTTWWGYIFNAHINKESGLIVEHDLSTETQGSHFIQDDLNTIISYQRYRKSQGLDVEQSAIDRLLDAGLFDSVDIIQNTKPGDSVFLWPGARELIETEFLTALSKSEKSTTEDILKTQIEGCKDESDFATVVSQFSSGLLVNDGFDLQAQQHEMVRGLNAMTPATAYVGDGGKTEYKVYDDFNSLGQNTYFPLGMSYRYITSEERDTIRYLFGTGQTDRLEEYKSLLEPRLRTREHEADKKQMQAWIDEEGPWGEIVAGMHAIVNGLLAPISYVDTWFHAIAGTEVDTTSYAQRMGQDAATYREMALSTSSGVGRFLGDVFLSIGQNLPMLLTGPAGLVWMGLSSAGIEAAQQNLSGASAWEAVGYSTAMGVVEVLTEKLPFDKLLDLAKDVKSIKDWLKRSTIAMGMDMGGEALATGTQNYLDMLLLGEDSRYWQRVNELMSGDTPLTSTQAQATARFELFFFEPIYSAGVGMGSTAGMSGAMLGGHLLRNGINRLKNGNQTADNQSTAVDISQPKTKSIKQAQDRMAQLMLAAPPKLPMLPASPERLLLTEGQTANNSDMTSTNTTEVSETTANQPATVGQAIGQLSQQDPSAKVSKATGNAIASFVGDMLDMGRAIPRGVRGVIMAAYRTFEAGGTNGQAVALLTTANQSIVTAIANGLSAKTDVRGLVALHDSMKTALTQKEQQSNAVAANAANDVGELFSSYFDVIGADEMPSLSEFAKLYCEGGNAWQELTLRKQWKEAVRSGEIGFFTEFDEYKAMAAVDGQGEAGYNKQNDITLALVRKLKELGDGLLDFMEESGGHTLDRHVGKSVEYLTERVKTLKGKGATSYYDKSIATRAVQDAISQHSEEIIDWLQNSDEPRLTVNSQHIFEVGNGVRRGTEVLINGLVHTTTILKRSQNSLRFIIITSYPVFE